MPLRLNNLLSGTNLIVGATCGHVHLHTCTLKFIKRLQIFQCCTVPVAHFFLAHLVTA